jgi:hypothetical protein
MENRDPEKPLTISDELPEISEIQLNESKEPITGKLFETISLPAELLVEVIKFLRLADVLVLESLNRTWKLAIRSDVIWKSLCLRDGNLLKTFTLPSTSANWKSFYKYSGLSSSS